VSRNEIGRIGDIERLIWRQATLLFASASITRAARIPFPAPDLRAVKSAHCFGVASSSAKAHRSTLDSSRDSLIPFFNDRAIWGAKPTCAVLSQPSAIHEIR
jgi:hypothetical protein